LCKLIELQVKLFEQQTIDIIRQTRQKVAAEMKIFQLFCIREKPSEQQQSALQRTSL